MNMNRKIGSECSPGIVLPFGGLSLPLPLPTAAAAATLVRLHVNGRRATDRESGSIKQRELSKQQEVDLLPFTAN